MALGHFAKLAVALSFGLVLGSGAQAQVAVTDPSDLANLYAKAMAESDIETIVAFYAENGILLTPEGPIAAGRDQVRQLMTRNFSGGAKLSMRFNGAQIDGGGGNAVTIWDWVLEVALPGREPLERHVRSMLYLKQAEAGGAWFIVADMYQVLPE